MKNFQIYRGFNIVLLMLGIFIATVQASDVTEELCDRCIDDTANYCMDVVIDPFHMVPDGSCAVRDYREGKLQQKFYPFTQQEHLFNCEVFGEIMPLPTGVTAPTSVFAEVVTGTIDGLPLQASLFSASLTNWLQGSCLDPDDPSSCTFQLAQPFFASGFARVTDISVFEGVITIDKGNSPHLVPVVFATRGAGIMLFEDLVTNPPTVVVSATHSLLGLAIYDAGEGSDDLDVIDGGLDMLMQGNIFSPLTVEQDPGAAVIQGSICSRDLYRKLNCREGRER